MADNRMTSEDQPPSEITDSPWFWVCVFSAMALAGTLALSPKYAERQREVELEYEGHLRSQEFKTRVVAADGDKERVRQEMAREHEGETLDTERELAIRLTPFYVLLTVVFLVSLGRVCWIQAKAEQAPLLDLPRSTLLLLAGILAGAMFTVIWYTSSTTLADTDQSYFEYVPWALDRSGKTMLIFLIASILMVLALSQLRKRKPVSN